MCDGVLTVTEFILITLVISYAWVKGSQLNCRVTFQILRTNQKRVSFSKEYSQNNNETRRAFYKDYVRQCMRKEVLCHRNHKIRS
jgi:hypothetical protein